MALLVERQNQTGIESFGATRRTAADDVHGINSGHVAWMKNPQGCSAYCPSGALRCKTKRYRARLRLVNCPPHNSVECP